MKRTIIIFLFFMAACTTLFGGNITVEKERKEQAENWMQQQPVQFLENKGQMTDMNGHPVPFVLFKAESPGMNMYITEKGITYVFVKAEEEEHEAEKAASPGEDILKGREKEGAYRWSRIDMELKGASIKKEHIVKENPSVTDFNYFYPHCPDGIYGVKEYEKITIKEIYPGIDWVFYNSTEKGMKYDFVVHPGSDAAQIKLLYQSKKKLQIDEEGNIQLKTPYGTLTENAPVSYVQETQENILTQFIKTKVNSYTPPGSEKDKGYETEISFQLVNDISHPVSTLIIDPQLFWATQYGGNTGSGSMCIAADRTGNIFVTGYGGSNGFPLQNAGTYFQGTSGGGYSDAFILKFNNSGVRLWATLYGGLKDDYAHSIATDTAGNVLVTGRTGAGVSNNFPIQNAGTFYQGTHGGGTWDVFILKFDNAGNRLWATFYGGSDSEEGNCIYADAAGNVFVTGYTMSSDLPIQNAGTYFQGTYGGNADAFILKFDNAGNRLWATYYGGSGNDVGNSITSDATGNVFVTGAANSANFPLQNAGGNFFQGTPGGTFILKFDNTGNRLWATYHGGTSSGSGNSIIADAWGNVFVTGRTAAGFPLLNAGTFFQGTYGGGSIDAFIMKFDNAGNRLWATYYGGSGDDQYGSYKNLAVDGCGNVYVSLNTTSNMITQNSCDVTGYNDTSLNGGSDQFIAVFSNAGALLWTTYLGGDANDFREAIALDRNNNLFITGEWGTGVPSTAGTYPFLNPLGGAYYNNFFAPGDNSFIAKFFSAPCLCAPVTASALSTNILCHSQCTGTATASATGGSSPYTYLWNTIPVQATQTATALCAGIYTVTITDASNNTVTATVTVTEPPALTGVISSVNVLCNGGNNGSATVTPSGGTPLYSYSWSPSGGTDSTAIGLSAGTYNVMVTDSNGCTDTLSATITEPPPIIATAVSTNTDCGTNTGTATVSASNGATPYTYLWNNSQNDSTATSLAAGIYTVTVTDANNCTQTATVTVNANGGPTANAGINVTITSGNSTVLNATGGGTYYWSTGDTTSFTTVSPTTDTEYCVTVTDVNNCWDTACVKVFVEALPCPTNSDLSVPNAFSPNDDGQNDIFCLQGWGYCIKTFIVHIYDRWGENVFESSNPAFCWDGTYKGKAMDAAVFVYYIKAELTNNEEVIRKGNISLIR